MTTQLELWEPRLHGVRRWACVLIGSDCGDKQLGVRAQCVDITPELDECSTVRVHFDFNDANLHETAGPKLGRPTHEARPVAIDVMYPIRYTPAA